MLFYTESFLKEPHMNLPKCKEEKESPPWKISAAFLLIRKGNC